MTRAVSPDEAMRRIDELLAHVWMVRTFLKHSEEARDDEELCDVHRALYDIMLALGRVGTEGAATAYVRQAQKKMARLKAAADRFRDLQPDVSGHTNFRMAVVSLDASVREIGDLLARVPPAARSSDPSRRDPPRTSPGSE